jgi:PAS domain S-box-containing protein
MKHLSAQLQLSRGRHRPLLPILASSLAIMSCVVLIESFHEHGIDLPVPFLVTTLLVAISACMGGLGPGLASAGIWAGYVIFAALTAFVPPDVTGGPLRVTVGIASVSVLACLLGYAKERRDRLAQALKQSKANLIEQVEQQTAELQRTNQQLQQEVRTKAQALEQLQHTEVELRQKEERWQLVLKGTNDGIWDWDVQRDTVFFSDRWKQMRGLNTDEVTDQADEWRKGIHPDDIDRVTQAVMDHFARKTTFFSEEYRVQRKDGTYMWVLDRGQALWDEQTGEPIRMSGSEKDISDRKQAEALLIEYRHHLEELVSDRTAELSAINLKLEQELRERQRIETSLRQVNQQKNELISVFSHEIRTTLTSIHTPLNLLADGFLEPSSEQGLQMVKIATTGANHLVNLVSNILDLERLESGKNPLNLQRSNLADLMTEATHLMQMMAVQAGVTLAVYPLNIELRLDPSRILQVMTNLLSNAIKFSPVGGTVWFQAEWFSDRWMPDDSQTQPSNSPAHVVISIKDQGRGIPSSSIDLIFDRFQQVQRTDTTVQKGTGLGLAISRSIVHQHQGQIWVESILGQGSCFYVTLPVLNL